MSQALVLDQALEQAAVADAPEAAIWVVGDSITKGVTFDEGRGRHILLKGQDFCSLVGQKLKAAVQNFSKFGCVSTAARATLEERLKTQQPPALVALELGGNDCDFDWEAIAKDPKAQHAPKTSLEAYEQNLTAMIRSIYAAGSQPVLFNLPPIDADRYFRYFTGGDGEKGCRILQWLGSIGRIYWWHERYNATAERVAQQTRTPLLMIRSALLSAFDYRTFVSGDGMHPNAEGHRRMADAVLEYIKAYRPGMLVS